MAKFVTIVLFLAVIGITGYIYLNFESVNFISEEPVSVSTNTGNRFIPGSRNSNNGDTTTNFWFTEGSTESLSGAAWTQGTAGYDDETLQTLKDLNDAYAKSAYSKEQIAYQTAHHVPSVQDYPSVPDQKWVQENVLSVLRSLRLPNPRKSNWLRAKPLTLLKSYYSPKADILYTGIPKSGCTNWKFTLLKIEGMFYDDVPNPKVHYIINRLNMANTVYRRKYNRNSLSSKYTYTVIRNPWTRMASGYNDKFSSSRAVKWQKGKVALQILRKYRDKNITIKDVLEEGFRPTFLEFLYHLAYDSPNDINAHFRPQYQMLDLSNVLFNFIGSLEHAKEQSKEIFTHFKEVPDISVPGPYDSSSDPRTERSTLFARDQFKKVPQQLLDLLYKKYKPDFMIYNYSNFTDPLFPFPIYHN